MNLDLLERTYAEIAAHPENHNQRLWGTSSPKMLPEGNTCGSAFCFFGTAVVLAGYDIVFDADGDAMVLVDGEEEILPTLAYKVLGFDDPRDPLYWWKYTLAGAGNRLEDIRSMLDAIRSGMTAEQWIEKHSDRTWSSF